MGIRSWHSLKAGFKQKLDMPNLHEETDEIFEGAAGGLPEMFQALKESAPETDFNRMWRNDFSQKLEIIAAQQTRRSQAMECRSLLLKSTEELEQARALIGQPLLSRMFFEENITSDMSDEMVGSMVAKFFILRAVDTVALGILVPITINRMNCHPIPLLVLIRLYIPPPTIIIIVNANNKQIVCMKVVLSINSSMY